MKSYVWYSGIIAGAFVVWMSGEVAADPLNIAQTPLFTSIQPDPNLMITVDDSRSMERTYMPEEITNLGAAACDDPDACGPLVGIDPFDTIAGQEVKYSAQTNRIYYDPRVTYTPWVDYQGEPCPTVDYRKVPDPKARGGSKTTAALRLCQFKDHSDPTAANFPNDTIDLSQPEGDGKAHYSGMNGYAEYWIYTGEYPSKSPDNQVDNSNCAGGLSYTIEGKAISPDPCLTGSYIPVVITPDIDIYSGKKEILAANLAYQRKFWDNFFAPFGATFEEASPKLNAQLNNDISRDIIGVYEDRTGRTDCVNADQNFCTYKEEITNFANWYVYYRFRKHVIRAAIGQAVAQSFIKSNQAIRLGFGRTTWSGPTDTGGDNTVDFGGTVKLGVRRFTVIDPVTNEIDQKATDSNRKTFYYDNLYDFVGTEVAKLERAIDDVGLYFQNPGSTGPSSNNPETADKSPQLACRQNYHVLLTDGYSFGTNLPGSDAREGPRTALPNGGNVDGTDGPNYQASLPYKDPWSKTLADYSMYYWSTDLRPDLPNLVPTTATEFGKDQANWQHLVNFTVGLGVYGTLTPDTIDADGNFKRSDDSRALCIGIMDCNPTKSWPDPQKNAYSNNAEKIDDLWHVAVNSRGNYFNATDPKSLSTVLKKVMSTIVVGTNESAAAAAANAARLDSGQMVYQAKFRQNDWTGQLLAYPVDANGYIRDKNENGAIDDGDASWDAAIQLSGQLKSAPGAAADISSRNVYSYNREGTVGCPANDITDKGIVFSFDNLNCTQRIALTQKKAGDKDFADYGKELVRYILGDDKDEKQKDGTGKFRNRTVIVDGKTQFRPLGDIVNSDPLFVGGEDYGYSLLPGAEGASYPEFLAKKNLNIDGESPRPRMIYVGANDGMLHGFEVGTWRAKDKNGKAVPAYFDEGSGNEVFAYIPGSMVNKNLSARATSDPVNHKYLVDGSPVAGDAYLDRHWHTVLLGTTGAGGFDEETQVNLYGSVFALDITDPSIFAVDRSEGVKKVLWEFTKEDDEDLGVPVVQPNLARMQNGKWAAIVANGYDSANGKPVLYVLDMSKKPGEADFIMQKFEPCKNNKDACPGGKNNGLSTSIPVDVDGDKRVDYIFAGDLLGNMWKFDVVCPQNRDDKKPKQLKSNPADQPDCKPKDDWKVANDGSPLFTACDPEGSCKKASGRQPITGKPEVGSVGTIQLNERYSSGHTQPSMMVYFGTGKYLEASDTKVGKSPRVETFYGVWDKNSGGADDSDSVSGRDELQEQKVLATVDQAGLTFRVTSNFITCYSGDDCGKRKKLGWYMDLPTPGERSVGAPVLINGYIRFVTLIPSDDDCVPGGTGWIMELAAISGGAPAGPIFDFTGAGNRPDGKFDANDMVDYNGKTPPSGVQSTAGLIKAAQGSSRKFPDGGNMVCSSVLSATGNTARMLNINSNPTACGRMSWRQLR